MAIVNHLMGITVITITTTNMSLIRFQTNTTPGLSAGSGRNTNLTKSSGIEFNGMLILITYIHCNSGVPNIITFDIKYQI